MIQYRLRRGWPAMYAQCTKCGYICYENKDAHVSCVSFERIASVLHKEGISEESLSSIKKNIPSTVFCDCDMYVCIRCGAPVCVLSTSIPGKF